MTAAAQPLDQGIIQSFKLRYRRSLMDKLLASAEYCKSSTEFTASINVLDSVRWIRAAWDSLDRSTIIKCLSGQVLTLLMIFRMKLRSQKLLRLHHWKQQISLLTMKLLLLSEQNY